VCAKIIFIRLNNTKIIPMLAQHSMNVIPHILRIYRKRGWKLVIISSDTESTQKSFALVVHTHSMRAFSESGVVGELGSKQ